MNRKIFLKISQKLSENFCDLALAKTNDVTYNFIIENEIANCINFEDLRNDFAEN